MKKTAFSLCAVLSAAWPAAALAANPSTTFEVKCAKASVMQTVDVPGETKHAFGISKGTCVYLSGAVLGIDGESGAYASYTEIRGGANTYHGVFMETAVNGDRLFYTYTGAGTPSGTAQHTWTAGGGTGKFAGLTGSGSCTGKIAPDGTSTFVCTGSYTPRS